MPCVVIRACRAGAPRVRITTTARRRVAGRDRRTTRCPHRAGVADGDHDSRVPDDESAHRADHLGLRTTRRRTVDERPGGSCPESGRCRSSSRLPRTRDAPAWRSLPPLQRAVRAARHALQRDGRARRTPAARAAAEQAPVPSSQIGRPTDELPAEAVLSSAEPARSGAEVALQSRPTRPAPPAPPRAPCVPQPDPPAPVVPCPPRLQPLPRHHAGADHRQPRLPSRGVFLHPRGCEACRQTYMRPLLRGVGLCLRPAPRQSWRAW